THSTFPTRRSSDLQAIQHESNQKFYKFIRVNCAFYDESSLEELLFGYEANPNECNRISDKKGLFEEANKGTIFLDEISSISLQLQEKLLHVIRDKKIYRIGGTTSISLDIRIITATNANLEKAV